MSIVWTEGEGGKAETFRESLRPIPLAAVAAVDKDEFGGDCGIDY